MGRYDDIDPDELRGDLAAFARLVLRLERDGRLLEAAPGLQRLIGELRQKLFAYEVRGTQGLGPRPGEDLPSGDDESEEVDPAVRQSLRVVREALEREREAREEWDPSEDEGDEG